MSFAIVLDGTSRYLPRTWRTRHEAARELLGLLKPYPRTSEWWRRLRVEEVTGRQRRTARSTRVADPLSIDGETRTLAEWAERAGLRYETLRKRIVHGWSPAFAISVPTRRKSTHAHT